MAFGFTYTLPTITGSHTDFPVVLKTADFPSAAIDGTGDAIDNGGGNLRAYTDNGKGTQLSVEVVTFVSSGSPEAEVWVKIPTAATGNTIFIEADSVETSQPAVGAAFGRNSVWSDFILVMHMESTSPVDSTGNNTSITGNALTAVAGNIGGALDFNGSTSDIDLGAAILPTGDFTQSVWVNPDIITGFRGYIGNFVPAETGRTYLGQNGSSFNWDGYTSAGNTRGTLSTATWFMFTVTRSGSTVLMSIDGAQSGASITDSGTPNTDHNTFIGALDQGTNNFYDGQISEIRLSNNNTTQDTLGTEHDNQNASSAWGTVGAWADSGAAANSLLLANRSIANFQGIRQ